MEQLYDYKMVENRSVVEQAHEFQALAKELELFPCPLPNKFVAGGIIAKLPPSWKDFHNSTVHDFRRLKLFSAARGRPPKIIYYFRRRTLAAENRLIFGGL
jgi:hypothetical protein